MIGGALWWSFPSVSWVTEVIFSSFASFFSLGMMTWVKEYRSSWHRHSHEIGNWMVGTPPGMVAMLRKERLNDSCGKYGELVKIFITTMAGSCESCWTRVGSMTEGSTYAWSEGQKTVTITSFPSSTPSVMRIATGMISLLPIFLLEWVMKLTPAWPHILGVTSLVKSPSNTTQKQGAHKHGSLLMDVHSSAGNDGTKLGSTRSSS